MKHCRRQTITGAVAGLLLIPWCIQTASAQQLELGRITSASLSSSEGTAFQFDAKSAGILTVAARSTDQTDILLAVTDMDGQQLPNGRSDQDIGGNTGAEQFAITIPRSGSYRVMVQSLGGGSATFKIGASWLSFPDLEVPPDPDGSPSTAIVLSLDQQAIDGAIDGTAGDYWDWYVLTSNQSGTLTVATRAEEGDLILQAFQEGEYNEALEHSDQDLQGVAGNEALTLVVDKGQKFYFKVSAFNEGASLEYRLQVGLMPG